MKPSTNNATTNVPSHILQQIQNCPAGYKPVYAAQQYSYSLTVEEKEVAIPTHRTGNSTIPNFTGTVHAFSRVVFEANAYQLNTVPPEYTVVFTESNTPMQIESVSTSLSTTTAGSTQYKQGRNWVQVNVTSNGKTNPFSHCYFKTTPQNVVLNSLGIPEGYHILFMRVADGQMPILKEVNENVTCMEAGHNPSGVPPAGIGNASGATEKFKRLLLTTIPKPQLPIIRAARQVPVSASIYPSSTDPVKQGTVATSKQTILERNENNTSSKQLGKDVLKMGFGLLGLAFKEAMTQAQASYERNQFEGAFLDGFDDNTYIAEPSNNRSNNNAVSTGSKTFSSSTTTTTTPTINNNNNQNTSSLNWAPAKTIYTYAQTGCIGAIVALTNGRIAVKFECNNNNILAKRIDIINPRTGRIEKTFDYTNEFRTLSTNFLAGSGPIQLGDMVITANAVVTNISKVCSLLILCDLNKGTYSKLLDGVAISHLRALPTGKILVAYSNSLEHQTCGVKIFNPTTARMEKSYHLTNNAYITAIEILAGNKVIVVTRSVTCEHFSDCFILDLSSEQHELFCHLTEEDIYGIVSLPPNQVVFSSQIKNDSNNHFKYWNLHTKKCVAQINDENNFLQGSLIELSNDRTLSSMSQGLKIWNFTTRVCEKVFDKISNPRLIAKLSDSEVIVVSSNSQIQLLQSDKVILTPQAFNNAFIANAADKPSPAVASAKDTPVNRPAAAALQKATFDDFFGVDEQIQEVSRFFAAVKINPNCKQHFLLLSGSPGTGKTELAKAVSSQCGFLLREFPRNEKNDQYIGQLEKRISEFFAEAKSQKRPIALFMDEIDAICPALEGQAQAGHHNQDAVISVIQTEIDKLVGTQVILIGATNYLEKIKEAIRSRAGTSVIFKLPNKAIRKQIIEHCLRKITVEANLKIVDAAIYDHLAEATPEWSPRLLKQYLDNVKNKAESAISKKERNKREITNQDLESCFESSRENFKQIYKKDFPAANIEAPKLLLQKKGDIFVEIVGLSNEIKTNLAGICAYIRNPAPYRKNLGEGNAVNRNTLFWGPPGTGKTERARLIAQNSNALFININAGSYKYPGDEKKLEKIFKLAKSFEKAIIFIDEIHDITQIHETTLLTELDGFVQLQENVLVVMAATNYPARIPQSILSRFPYQIEVSLPDELQRLELFKLYLRKTNIPFEGMLQNNAEKAYEQFAKESEGLAPRDIKFLINRIVVKLTDEEIVHKTKALLSIDIVKAAIVMKRNELGLSEKMSRGQSSVSKTPTAPYEIPTQDLQCDFDINAQLGQGNYGVVYKGEWQKKPVAIKVLNANDNSMEDKNEFKKEINLMMQLKHCNIVGFYGTSVSRNGNAMLIMEYVAKGSLYNILHNNEEKLPWTVRIQITIDIGLGVEYLHSQKVIHCDLNSHNVLITNEYRAKLTDFGLSKIKHDITSRSNSGSGNMLGTLLWMAPELTTGEKTNNSRTDIYSYGVTMWEIAARKKPFAGMNPTIQALKIASGTRETIPAETPLNYAKLIKKCWDQRAEERPTATQVVEELTALKL